MPVKKVNKLNSFEKLLESEYFKENEDLFSLNLT